MHNKDDLHPVAFIIILIGCTLALFWAMFYFGSASDKKVYRSCSKYNKPFTAEDCINLCKPLNVSMFTPGTTWQCYNQQQDLKDSSACKCK